MKRILLFGFFSFCFLALILKFISVSGQARVSDSMIDKFIFINETLEYTLDGVKQSIDIELTGIKKRVHKNGNDPAGINNIRKLEELYRETTKVFDEIKKLKDQLTKQVGGGIDPHTNVIKEPRAESKVRHIMLGNRKDGIGYKLKKELNAYVEYLNKQFAQDQTLGFSERFKFENLAKDNKDLALYENNASQKNRDFVEHNFGECPVVAALALLTQKQHDILRYQAEVYKKFGSGDFSISLE